jgi:hypothetical protein
MNKITTVLEDYHIAEACRRKAEFCNLGWYSGPTRIESKTDKGILVSIIAPNLRRVTHRWYNCEALRTFEGDIVVARNDGIVGLDKRPHLKEKGRGLKSKRRVSE